MRRKLTSVLALLVMVMAVGLLTACSASSGMAVTYDVNTGDKIKISLDTTGGYSMNTEVPFTITANGEEVAWGTFLMDYGYDSYVEAAETSELATILDQGTVNGNEYIFWQYDDTEWNCAISIGGSNTGLLLSDSISQDSARECFSRISITVVSSSAN